MIIFYYKLVINEQSFISIISTWHYWFKLCMYNLDPFIIIFIWIKLLSPEPICLFFDPNENLTELLYYMQA